MKRELKSKQNEKGYFIDLQRKEKKRRKNKRALVFLILRVDAIFVIAFVGRRITIDLYFMFSSYFCRPKIGREKGGREEGRKGREQKGRREKGRKEERGESRRVEDRRGEGRRGYPWWWFGPGFAA